jgi:hypothetical protein
MTTTTPRFGVFYRVARSKKWWMHDTFTTWDEAMTAALSLDASATWVSEIPPPGTTDTELTPPEAEQRPVTQPRLFGCRSWG